MILILGKTHDDILYFENIMHNKQEEKYLTNTQLQQELFITKMSA